MVMAGYEFTLGRAKPTETCIEIQDVATGRQIEKVYNFKTTYRYQDPQGFFSLDSFTDFVKAVVLEHTINFFEGV